MKIEDFIIKYINNEADTDELSHLNSALKSEEAKKLLKDYISVDHVLDSEFHTFNVKKALNQFDKKIKDNLKIKWRKRAMTYFKYAAIIVVIIGSAVTFNYFSLNREKVKSIDNNGITLELEDGSIKVLNPNINQKIVDSEGSLVGKQDHDRIIYNDKSTQSKESLSYNKLYIPYGKKFQIELSDGTLVYLNSGSTLRYPVRFIKGMPREVFLEGEAYFEVSKDKNDSFIVNTSDLNTEVYGTEFNISCYKDDNRRDVVLVEGSVGVYSPANKRAKDMVMLTPNKKASLDKRDNIITTTNVEVNKYIAWKDGVLFFKNERFENIIKKLERHYNVTIQNNYSELNNIRFTGTFDIESIEQVLKAFQAYRSFNILLTDQKIIINQKNEYMGK